MGFMDPPLRGPCNFASFTTFFLLLSVGYPNSKNRYCQIIWSTQSRHRNQHWVTYRLQELRLMRKSIFTSLWTLAFIQAKDHQSQIDQISEDFQTEFSYRGRMIIPARRPLSGSVTPYPPIPDQHQATQRPRICSAMPTRCSSVTDNIQCNTMSTASSSKI